MRLKYIAGGFMAAMLIWATSANTAEFSPASVRALGMGGSNIASTNGVDATYWNPAAYGFFSGDDASSDTKAVDNNNMSDKGFGFELGGGAGLYIFGPLGSNQTIVQGLPTSVLGATGAFDNTQIRDAATLVDGLSSLDDSPMGATVSVNGTLGARVANYGFGWRTSLDFSNTIDVDNVNVGLPDLVAAFNNPLVTTPQNQYFTAAQSSSLVASLVANGYTSAEANSIVGAYDVALAADAGAAGRQQAMIDALLTLSSSAGDLTQNNTSLSTRGVAISEIGFTYGYAFDEALSVGGVIKYLQADILASDTNILGQNSDLGSINQDNLETASGFGLDIGVMYRMPSWQFGLTVKNLNSPSFEHSSGYVYELKPQAKVGAAWIPSSELTVEIGLDVTENEGAIKDSKSQYWNIGAEWDAWKVLAIRLGAFQNMSQTDIGVVPTIGLGLNLWAVRLDIGYAQSTKTVELDGSDFPAYQLASLALAVDF